MTSIRDQVLINAPVAKVYRALATPEGVSTWWDKQESIQTDRGLVMEHNPGPEHGIVRLRVVELVPNRRVEWECISSHPKTSPASAWTGTHFIFDIAARQGGGAKVDFRQDGYDEKSEFFEFNKSAWAEVLQNLKKVVEAQRS